MNICNFSFGLRALIFSIMASTLIVSEAFACRSIHGYTDVNCDGKFKIAVIGDSISAGTRGNLRSAGSYVKRVQRYFPYSTIYNLGYPGLDTVTATRFLRKDFPENRYGVKKSLLKNADFVLIQLGVNDFFSGSKPKQIIKRLQTINTLVSNYVSKPKGIAPLTAIAFITPVVGITPKRAEQSAYVENLNKALRRAKSESFPVAVGFDKLSTAEIFSDGLHPSSDGQDHMAEILGAYVKKVLRKRVVKS